MSSPSTYAFNNKYFNQKLSLCLETNALKLKKSPSISSEQLDLSRSFHGLLRLTDGSVLFDLSAHQKNFIFGHNSPLQIKAEAMQNESPSVTNSALLKQLNDLWKTTYQSIRVIKNSSLTGQVYDLSSLQNGDFFLQKLYLSNPETLTILNLASQSVTLTHQSQPNEIEAKDFYFFYSSARLLTQLPWTNAFVFEYLKKMEKAFKLVNRKNLEITFTTGKGLSVADFLSNGIFIDPAQIQKNNVTFFFPLTLRTNQLDEIFAILVKVLAL